MQSAVSRGFNHHHGAIGDVCNAHYRGRYHARAISSMELSNRQSIFNLLDICYLLTKLDTSLTCSFFIYLVFPFSFLVLICLKVYHQAYLHTMQRLIIFHSRCTLSRKGNFFQKNFSTACVYLLCIMHLLYHQRKNSLRMMTVVGHSLGTCFELEMSLFVRPPTEENKLFFFFFFGGRLWAFLFWLHFCFVIIIYAAPYIPVSNHEFMLFLFIFSHSDERKKKVIILMPEGITTVSIYLRCDNKSP